MKTDRMIINVQTCTAYWWGFQRQQPTRGGSRDNSLLVRVPETTAYSWGSRDNSLLVGFQKQQPTRGFQRQQPTRGGTVRCHQHLQIVVNSFLCICKHTVQRFFQLWVSSHRLNRLITL